MNRGGCTYSEPEVLTTRVSLRTSRTLCDTLREAFGFRRTRRHERKFHLPAVHQRRTARTPKSNRMPDAPHSVKVETQVVDRIQDLRQYFVRCIKMAQIGPRIASAHAAGAARIERPVIARVARLFDRHLAFGSIKKTMPGAAGGQDAVHHVDAQPGVLRDLLRSAHAHEIAWLVCGEMLES